MTVRVRRIQAGDWAVLRQARLAALADSPRAFGQTREEAALQPAEEWRSTARSASRGDRRAWFLAEDDSGRTVGLVLGRRRPPADCLLFSMWVQPDHRQQGTGSALVQAIANWGASWGARRIVLWVIMGNEDARRFYERIGFRQLPTGPDAESGAAYGAIAMERPLAG